MFFLTFISQALPLGASNKGGMGKTSYFHVKCVNVSKTVGDTGTSNATINN